MKEATERRVVLLTGANSGVGLEAAAQLAEAGWGSVILACRTAEKASIARARLVARVGRDVFDTLAVDTSEVSSARAAAEELDARGVFIDALVLNAGASSAQPRYNSGGVEMTWASTLVGHHVLTMRLWQMGLLKPNARIVMSGSEGARGNLPGSELLDLEGLADAKFEGDMAEAIVQSSRTEVQREFANMREYVTAKLVVAWWVGAMARRLPMGMAINAVSPGSAPASNFARSAGGTMRVMMTVMKLVGPLFGMAGSLRAAARRYVEALEFDSAETGHFYATAHPRKLVGPMARQEYPAFFSSRRGQEAALEALVRLTGHGPPERPAEVAQ